MITEDTQTLTERTPQISIDVEMKRSYLDYAMSVIIGRALPDVRDGLKPVHRRVLFAMHELKNDYNKPFKKAARIVGDVIGKYHPHGDTAVYDTIVRMAQDFSLRYTIVDGQGNFGSVDGDPPAAMRYTEIRMTKLAHQMLEDLEKETVNFVPNYDESLTEPSVLPSKIPCLLINGSSGIAVGMATNIPPHNLNEIILGIKALINNPDITFEELLNYIPGPDFPTGGIICGTQGIYEAYRTGRGIIKIRAKALVEKDKKTGTETIIIKEIPYQVIKAKIIEKIAELMKDKNLEGIKYVRDESDREGMRIAIGLKKDQNSDVILNQLYKNTQLETSFGIIFLAIVNNRPELLSIKELLEHFIIHRKDIITRRTQYELKKAEERAHILEGLKIAIDHLDSVVTLIRSSKTPAEAKERLLLKFKLTQIQAQAILEMRLQRLTGLERDKIIEEYENVLKDIGKYKEILGNDKLVLKIIEEEITEIQNEFGDERRTLIVKEVQDIKIEDLILEEDMVVTITNSGYIKRSPSSIYQSQRRGGRGKIGMATKEEDFISNLFIASTHHTFLFFTNLGRVYKCKVYDIPQATRQSKGKAIINLLNFQPEERLSTVLAVPSFDKGQYIFMATRHGTVKKADLMSFANIRSGGIIAIGLDSDDELISARLTDGNLDVFMCSSDGQAVRFHESDVRSMGRNAVGVIGMRLDKGDYIVGMEVLSHGKAVLAATENGYGKRSLLDEYIIHKRGGKGVITIKTSERNGKVVAILLVEEDDDIMLITDRGKIVRTPVKGISVISRNTQGVKLIGMEEGEKLVCIARLAEKEEDAPLSEEIFEIENE
ncbi:MAG: DNA gyrase subunit A [Desulfobacterales bacterium]|nr:DNA gyrase subunit A [Desulfobacterales bacterium]MBF0397097.1 DNA gyrase subunit A [Desulfobacterales bacterium]